MPKHRWQTSATVCGAAAAPARRRSPRPVTGPELPPRLRQHCPGLDRPGRCDSPLPTRPRRSEEHTSELQSHVNLVCRLLLEKKKKKISRISSLKKKKKKINN